VSRDRDRYQMWTRSGSIGVVGGDLTGPVGEMDPGGPHAVRHQRNGKGRGLTDPASWARLPFRFRAANDQVRKKVAHRAVPQSPIAGPGFRHLCPRGCEGLTCCVEISKPDQLTTQPVCCPTVGGSRVADVVRRGGRDEGRRGLVYVATFSGLSLVDVQTCPCTRVFFPAGPDDRH